MKSIPIIKKTDVLILGASSGAVAATVAARNAGADAYLVSHLNYLGEDICAHLQYELAEDETPAGALGKALFAGEKRPARIKCVLEQAVVKSNADIMMGSFPVGALVDENGTIVGAVIANRCGRQAIIAKRIIDATEQGVFAKLAGAPTNKFKGGEVESHFRILAPKAKIEGALIIDDSFSVELKGGVVEQSIFEYSAKEKMTGVGVTDWGVLNRELIHRYWQHDATLISEHARVLPVERIKGQGQIEKKFKGHASFNLDCMKCLDGVVSVLGPAAHVNDDVAKKLSRPFHNMTIGNHLGRRLAEECASLATPIACGVVSSGNALPIDEIKTSVDAKLIDANAEESVQLGTEKLPRLGMWDTVVVGGGTGGASAAIASARQGVKTAVLEYQPALGGVGTLGQISIYYDGNCVGFTREMDEGVFEMGPEPVDVKNKYKSWKPSWKQAWYHSQLMGDHVDLLLQSTVYGVWVVDREVKGVLVATPYGHGLLESKTVIDSSGSAEVASAAGAPCRVINEEHVAVQGAGLSPISTKSPYNNTDHNFIDDNDMRDVTAAMISSKLKFKDEFDISQLVNSRERRQIYGEYELSPIDFFNDHTFSDSICLATSCFDTHGFTVHDVFTMKAPNRDKISVYVPFRALLPQGLDNVVVTGLGVSAQRDVLPVIRMQPDVQNQGYGMGYAASLVAGTNTNIRDVDIKAVQSHLVEIQNLDSEVLQHTDPKSISDEEIASVVKSGWDDYKGLAIIFNNKERSLPLIKNIFASVEGEQKLAYAKILGLMGNDLGESTLRQAILGTPWDEGWDYRGMGQYGKSMSPFDTIIMASKSAKSLETFDALANRIDELDADCYFSHARAIAIACEGFSEKAVNEKGLDAKNLAGKLRNSLYQFIKKEGMSGHHQHSLKDVQRDLTDDRCETKVRNRALRELVLARALYYCGDKEGLGKSILLNYAKDMRGIFARHASAILKA